MGGVEGKIPGCEGKKNLFMEQDSYIINVVFSVVCLLDNSTLTNIEFYNLQFSIKTSRILE